MAKTTNRGRVWVLRGPSGKLIEDIDTDQIYHNAYLHITELAEMGRYALGNLEGWKDFASKALAGDIVVAGRNFGAGSSRQQAVDCFIALKVGAFIAPSFASIYFRNAVNSAFPVLRSDGLEKLVAARSLEDRGRCQGQFRIWRSRKPHQGAYLSGRADEPGPAGDL